MKVLIVLVACLVIPSCLCFRKHKANGKLVHEFGQPLDDLMRKQSYRQISKLQAWSKCDKTAVYIVDVKSLSITPDPMQFPGSLTISTQFKINKDLVSPLAGNVTMEFSRSGGGPFNTLPCIAQVGTCYYDDVCQLLDLLPVCPQQLVDIGIDCHCPFKAKSYNFKPATFYASIEFLPGYYRIKVDLTMSGAEALCLQLTLHVE